MAVPSPETSLPSIALPLLGTAGACDTKTRRNRGETFEPFTILTPDLTPEVVVAAGAR
jgi:hypothetical protein